MSATVNHCGWHWHPAVCSCCGSLVLGQRMLVVRGRHVHHPLAYCIVGLVISVN